MLVSISYQFYPKMESIVAQVFDTFCRGFFVDVADLATDNKASIADGYFEWLIAPL